MSEQTHTALYDRIASLEAQLVEARALIAAHTALEYDMARIGEQNAEKLATLEAQLADAQLVIAGFGWSQRCRSQRFCAALEYSNQILEKERQLAARDVVIEQLKTLGTAQAKLIQAAVDVQAWLASDSGPYDAAKYLLVNEPMLRLEYAVTDYEEALAAATALDHSPDECHHPDDFNCPCPCHDRTRPW